MRSEEPKMLKASAKTQTPSKKCNSSATILHYYRFTGFSTRSATMTVTDPGGGRVVLAEKTR